MVELLDEVPTIVRPGGPRQPSPEVVQFQEELIANPGKWAEFPGNRKTKPKMDGNFAVVGRGGKWYASYVGNDDDEG